MIALGNAQQFNLGNEDAAAVIQSMYSTTPDVPVGRSGKDAFEAMKMIQSINQAPFTPAGPAGGPQYVRTDGIEDHGRDCEPPHQASPPSRRWKRSD